MPEQPLDHHSLSARRSGPLIGVLDEQDGQEVVRYFGDEAAAHAARSDATLRDALGVIGAWSDLDWDETVEELDRIRHESRPTPPIELDEV